MDFMGPVNPDCWVGKRDGVLPRRVVTGGGGVVVPAAEFLRPLDMYG